MADAVLATLRGIMTWYQSRHEDYVVTHRQGHATGQTEETRPHSHRQRDQAGVGRRPANAAPSGHWIKIAAAHRPAPGQGHPCMRWDDLPDGEWTVRAEDREKGTGRRAPTAALGAGCH